MVAVAIIGAAAVGGISTAYSSSQAASAQTNSANQANAQLAQQQAQVRSDLAPYRAAGEANLTELNKQMPFLTSPIAMNQANLEKTPGYQFTKNQGLKAVQNSAAARGLGVSGAALKGASEFATGLANNTYKDQFNLENINRTNTFNRLKGLVDTGQNASAQTAASGNQLTAQQAGNTIGAGNAQAAAYNATGAAISNAASNIGGYYTYKGLYGTGGSAPGAPGYYGGSPETNSNLAWG